MTAQEYCLMAAAVFPVVGAILLSLRALFQFPGWGLAAARTGLIGSCICSAVLAILLHHDESNDLPSSRGFQWTWFSMTLPRPVSLVFGLYATSIKALLAFLFGGAILAKQLSTTVQGRRPLSENACLVDILLCVALTSFLYAPSLAQSLLGWLAVSLLVGIVIRLSRESLDSQQNRSVSYPTRLNEFVEADANRVIQLTALSLSFVNRLIQGRIWRSATKDFPDWLGEQVEIVEGSAFSFQMLATILGSFAVLLTWLIVV